MTALGWLWLAAMPPETDPDRLLAALRQLQQQVRTLSCDLEHTSTLGSGKSRFVMDGPIIRISSVGPVGNFEYWSDGKITKSISTHSATRRTESRIDVTTNEFGEGDARKWALWHVGLFEWGPDGPKAMPVGRKGVHVAELLMPPNTMKPPRYDAKERTVRLEITCPFQCVFWTLDLDESRNWQPRRIVKSWCNPPPLAPRRDVSELVVEEFKEVVPGIAFPVKVVVRGKVGEQDLGDPATGISRTVFLTNVRINEPVPAASLAFHFPPHSEVSDLIQETVMVTDANGDVAGPARSPDGKVKRVRHGPPPLAVLPAQAPGAAPQAVELMTQTANMPAQNHTPWLWLAGGAGLFSLTLLVWWYRRA